MLVSIDRPALTAVTLEPEPRWAITSRSGGRLAKLAEDQLAGKPMEAVSLDARRPAVRPRSEGASPRRASRSGTPCRGRRRADSCRSEPGRSAPPPARPARAAARKPGRLPAPAASADRSGSDGVPTARHERCGDRRRMGVGASLFGEQVEDAPSQPRHGSRSGPRLSSARRLRPRAANAACERANGLAPRRRSARRDLATPSWNRRELQRRRPAVQHQHRRLVGGPVMAIG